MAMSLNQLTRANQPKPPRILIHGVAGVGKTTFAAEANQPVFVQTEDGLGTLSSSHFPLARTYEDVIDALAALYTEPHDFKTVVIDSNGQLGTATSVSVASGGTGTVTAPTQGGVIYAASTSAYGSTAAGTAGQVLVSNGCLLYTSDAADE